MQGSKNISGFDGLRREYEAIVLGWYDFDTIYMAPPHLIGNRYPRATESHEVMHKELTISSRYGVFQRLLLLLSKRILQAEEIDSYDKMFMVSLRNVFSVQEGIATWVTVDRIAGTSSPTDAQQYIERSLPQEYRDAYELVRQILPNPLTSRDNMKVMLSNWLAGVVGCIAMNTDVLEVFRDLEALQMPDFARYMAQPSASPDARLRMMVPYSVVFQSLQREVERTFGTRTQEVIGAYQKQDTPYEERVINVKSLMDSVRAYSFDWLKDKLPLEYSSDEDMVDPAALCLDSWNRTLLAQGKRYLADVELNKLDKADQLESSATKMTYRLPDGQRLKYDLLPLEAFLNSVRDQEQRHYQPVIQLFGHSSSYPDIPPGMFHLYCFSVPPVSDFTTMSEFHRFIETEGAPKTPTYAAIDLAALKQLLRKDTLKRTVWAIPYEFYEERLEGALLGLPFRRRVYVVSRAMDILALTKLVDRLKQTNETVQVGGMDLEGSIFLIFKGGGGQRRPILSGFRFQQLSKGVRRENRGRSDPCRRSAGERGQRIH